MSPSRSILLALLTTVFACPAPPPLPGEPAETPLDAGVADAGLLDAGLTPPTTGLDSGVVFLDWLVEREAPLEPVLDAELPGRPFALSATTYALETDCDAGVCTYSWYTARGTLFRRHTGLALAATNPFSNDGTKFAAIEVTDRFVCSGNGTSLPLVEGTFGLYDSRMGTRLFSQGPVVGDPGLITNTFSQHGTIVRLDRYDRATCELQESAPLLATAPFHRPEVLDTIPSDPGFPPYVEDDTADGQLIVSTRSGLNTPVGLARPRDVTSFRQLDGDHQLSRQSGGFLHVLGGWPYSRVASVHLSPGLRFDSALPSMEADFTSLVISHRWVMGCAQTGQSAKRCDAVDGLGVRPRRSTITGPALPAVAGALEQAVYRTPDGRVEQLDLVTGTRSTVDVPATTVRAVGNGSGFLLNDATHAWGLSRGAPFRLGERVLALYRGAASVEQPQSDVVFIVSSNESGSRVYLDVWNVKEGKVARVSDQLNFNPPFNAPFTADTQCAVPGFLRSLGPSAASASQPGRFIHFTTFIPAEQPRLQVFVMPSDLSSPPRRLAELSPDQCSPPLVSPGGERVWLPVVMRDGVRVVLAPL